MRRNFIFALELSLVYIVQSLFLYIISSFSYKLFRWILWQLMLKQLFLKLFSFNVMLLHLLLILTHFLPILETDLELVNVLMHLLSAIPFKGKLFCCAYQRISLEQSHSYMFLFYAINKYYIIYHQHRKREYGKLNFKNAAVFN